MCMGGRSSPPPTHRQYDSSKYYNGNIYDPKPNPPPQVSNQNDVDSDGNTSGDGTVIQTSGLSIVDDNYNNANNLNIV